MREATQAHGVDERSRRFGISLRGKRPLDRARRGGRRERRSRGRGRGAGRGRRRAPSVPPPAGRVARARRPPMGRPPAQADLDERAHHVPDHVVEERVGGHEHADPAAAVDDAHGSHGTHGIAVTPGSRAERGEVVLPPERRRGARHRPDVERASRRATRSLGGTVRARRPWSGGTRSA